MSESTTRVLTCEWPSCQHTWVPRAGRSPKICPRCKRDWHGPKNLMATTRMNPAKRAKLAIAHLGAAHLITKREAETLLIRAGISQEETKIYLKNFDFPLKLY